MFKLLIADDELIIRNGLASLNWASLGIDVLPLAANGIDAENTILTNNVDILLTDIRMPGKDGLDIAETLLSANPSAQIIFLSGYTEFEYAHRAIDLHAVSYIVKPARSEAILKSISEAIDRLNKLNNKKQTSKTYIDVNRAFDISPVPTCGVVVEYIVQHCCDDLSLAKLSEYFHFSDAYISRSIKKITGYSFVELLSAARMIQAAHLISSSFSQIVDISFSVGIQNEQYFSQIFKKHYGITPNAYRKNERNAQPIPIISKVEKMYVQN